LMLGILNTSANNLDDNWIYRSPVVVPILCSLGVLGLLFILWSIYLLLRFAISFHHASRELHRKWARDDHAVR